MEEREQSRILINQWVESNTNNKIREILKPQTLSQDTKLVLTNAIYFKGNWEMQFNKNATKEEDFKITPDKKVKVPMMSLCMKGFKLPEFRYAETEDLQVLELPVTFRADHPFIFLLQHNKTGAILFMGRVYEPKE